MDQPTPLPAPPPETPVTPPPAPDFMATVEKDIADAIHNMTPEQKAVVREEILKVGEVVAKNSWPTWIKTAIALFISVTGGGSITEGIRWAMAPGVDPPPAISIAETFTGKVMEPITLSCDTAGAKVRWRCVDGGLVQICDGQPKSTCVISNKPGKYRVECWTAINNEATDIYSTTVIVGDAPPDPPKPVPPTPPTPPDPPKPPTPPDPPAPVDPFVAKLQSAYDGDKGILVKKKAQVGLMAALFTEMVPHTADPKILTTGDLLADYKAAASTLIVPGTLTEMGKLLTGEITATFGLDSVNLDAPMRAKGQALWTKLAGALAKIKT